MEHAHASGSIPCGSRQARAGDPMAEWRQRTTRVWQLSYSKHFCPNHIEIMEAFKHFVFFTVHRFEKLNGFSQLWPAFSCFPGPCVSSSLVPCMVTQLGPFRLSRALRHSRLVRASDHTIVAIRSHSHPDQREVGRLRGFSLLISRKNRRDCPGNLLSPRPLLQASSGRRYDPPLGGGPLRLPAMTGFCILTTKVAVSLSAGPNPLRVGSQGRVPLRGTLWVQGRFGAARP